VTDIRLHEAIDYGGGHLLDIYEPESTNEAATLLLWHGSGANERDVLEPMARKIAPLGVTVIVPDWCPDSPDQGRQQLTDSFTFARRLSGDGHVPVSGVQAREARCPRVNLLI
jgi:hypothetical protein